MTVSNVLAGQIGVPSDALDGFQVLSPSRFPDHLSRSSDALSGGGLTDWSLGVTVRGVLIVSGAGAGTPPAEQDPSGRDLGAACTGSGGHEVRKVTLGLCSWCSA